MSSAGRAASSSGCVARPRGHETGLTGYAESIQHSSPTGSSAMETAEHREPYEPRGSRTDLGAPGGESPPGDSTIFRVATVKTERPVSDHVADLRRRGDERKSRAYSSHRPDGVPRHTRPVADSRHIGGLMPSFSTYMKFPVTLPSSPFGPARNTAAPGFSRLLSPGTGARIGTSGPMLYSDSPSLNLTCTTLPCGASVTVPTVALVITLSEPRSHANCRPPSGCASGKIRTSIAFSLPSVPFTPVEARKSPALMSTRDFLTRLWILVASVTAIFMSIPSRALTVRFAPSTFSIVPRTRTGGAAGGFCASAGSAKSMTIAAATADFRSIPPSHFLSWCADRCHRGWDLSSTAACPAQGSAQGHGPALMGAKSNNR